MARNRAVLPAIPLLLTDQQAGYLAGIIDGEGYVGICHTSGKQYLLRVVVASASHELVTWLQTTTGLGKISTFDLSRRGRQTSHQWRVCGRQAGVLLRAVNPLLIVKKAQAIIALRFQENTALSGDAKFAFAKQCSDSVKLLNSRQAWKQNCGATPAGNAGEE